MRHKFLFILSSILLTPYLFSQISIEDCYQKAKNNYPLIKQYGLIDKSKDFNLSNASKGYLPQIQLSAKASYQSEVTEIPISIPGVNIKGLKKDQYGVAVDISQNIWDGGNIGAKKELVKAKSEVDSKNVEITLYAIRDRINQLFFGILLHDELLAQNNLYAKDLQRSYEQIQVYIDNGVANQSDLDAVKLELAKTNQRKTELKYNRKAYLTMLSALIGVELADDIQLLMPNLVHTNQNTIRRPELAYFEAQQRSLDVQRKNIDTNLMPRFSAFVSGGYGRPGLNMLESKFSAYYMAGVRMTWNIGSFYTRKNTFKDISINKELIENQRETFLFNTNLDVTNSDNEIKKLQDLLRTDKEIIHLRTSIRQAAEVKAANGTLSVLDLMKEVNAEDKAKQDEIIHKIELIRAVYNLKYITNN